MALSCFGKSLVSFYRSIFPSKDQSATVIVGSGIIGTSTAFWLKENCPQKRVIIVEARPDAFSRASHYNSGILSYHWLPKELQAFGKYTYDVYLRLFKSNRAFREYTGFRDHSVFEIRPGHGPSMANIPPWANIPEGYHVGLEPSDGQAGVIDPVKLGEWLLAACRAKGVEIWTDSTVEGAIFSWWSWGLRWVRIRKNRKRLDLRANKLVLAAGPWTAGLVNRLFPNTRVKLGGTVNSGNWIILDNPSGSEKLHLAQLICDKVVGHQLEFVSRSDGTIWACGLNDYETPLDDVLDDSVPDEKAVKILTQHARYFIKIAGGDGQIPHVRQSGRSYRPTSKKNVPILAQLSASELFGKRKNGTRARKKENTGIYVCFGHGMYGITLGLGSGKILSQMVQDQVLDFDISTFTLP